MNFKDVISSVFTTIGSNKIHTRECSMCHVGQVKVEYYGSWDQFTETIEACKECGWSPDECEGC